MGKLYLGSQEVTPALFTQSGSSSKYGCAVDTFLGDVDASGKLQLPSNTSSDIVFTGVKSAAAHSLEYRFNYCQNLTSKVIFPDLIDADGTRCCYGMFYECIHLASASFDSLKGITGTSAFSYMFYDCKDLASVSFPLLETISNTNSCYGLFDYCSSLTSVSFPLLKIISGSNSCDYMFRGCTNIENIYFNSLTTTSFGSYTNQFQGMMQSTGNSKVHTIHFPSNLQSTIQGLSGYPLFGGGSGYVVLAFDLPSTEISGCCVSKDTDILYADNTTKKAYQVNVGDIIKGYDENKKEFCDVEVLEVRTPTRNGMIRVVLDDNNYIEMTTEHPLLSSVGWVSYDPETASESYKRDIKTEITKMNIGTELLQADGSYKKIKEIIDLNITEDYVAYTFDTTNGIDTYVSNNCVSHNHSI